MSKDYKALMTPALGGPEERAFSIADINLPDTDDIKELCRHVTILTTRRLIEIALDPATPEKSAIEAIKEINDRGFGKPNQTINAEMTIPDIDRMIVTLERKMIAAGISLDVIDVEEVEDEIID